MVVIISGKYHDLVREKEPASTLGIITVKEEDVEREILKSIEAERYTVAVYDNAMSDYKRLRKLMEARGLNPYIYAFVDPIEFEVANPINPWRLIQGKHSWLAYSMGNKALYKAELAKQVDRRSLLRSPLRSLMKYYPAPILLNEASCASWKTCRLCVDACPFNALKGKPPSVNLDACTGCGICTAYCPFGLIFMPLNNIQALEVFLDNVRKSYNGPLNVVFMCNNDLDKLVPLLKKAWRLNEDASAAPTVFLNIDCPGWISELHLLAVVNRGAKPFIYCSKETVEYCGGSDVVEKWLRNLGELGVPRTIYRRPEDLVNAIESYSSSYPPDRKQVIYKNKKELYNLLYELGVPKMRFDTPVAGLVEVDQEKCLLCDACSNMCPFNALKLKYKNDKIMLRFYMNNCVACGLCEAVCPYEALRLEYGYNRDFYNREKTIAEDELARCRMCGKPLGSKKNLLALESKLRSKGVDEWVIEQLWLCQECKVKRLVGGNTP